MHYEIENLPLQTLLPAIGRAEDQLARLDEMVRRSPVGKGFVERGHFFDAAASMWVAGELVHVEDLVLHDAHMDIRAPTHELTMSHSILRTRRRIADADPVWAISGPGISALAGLTAGIDRAPDKAPPPDVESGHLSSDDQEALSAEFAAIDAVIERSRRILEGEGTPNISNGTPQSIIVGELVIRDAEWDEQGRIEQWKAIVREVETMPPTLAAVILWDAWEALEPLQNRYWIGPLLVGAWLRSRGKIVSHLFCFNVGLKAIPRERRRSRNQTTRLLAALDAMSAAADAGMTDISRLSQAKDQMERRLRGKRSSSSLPAAIELILSRPIVSAAMMAKTATVTQRGALNLIRELGVREMTGRGRYRAWGVL